MTRVLHVLEALEGGTARHVSDLVTRLGATEHHVAAPERRLGGVTDTRARAEMAGAGAAVHPVDMRRRPASPQNAAAVLSLVALIRRLRPDVVHGHSSVGGALGRLALAASGGRAAAVYTPNGLHPSPAAAGVERLLGRWTSRLVAVSEGEARLAAVRGIVTEERIAVIPNGIDLSGPPPGPRHRPPALDLREGLGLGAATPLVGFVGRLVHQKAPEVLVAAAGLLRTDAPDCHVALIGAGREEARVDELIGRLGLGGRVHRLGHLEGAAGLMGQFDVLALPSRYEGCPYAALEAMRAGVPVVLSEVVGNRDVVEHGVSGLLTPAEDHRSLASAIARLLEDAPLRRRLVDGARRRLAERFDVTQTTARVGDLYEQLGAS